MRKVMGKHLNAVQLHRYLDGSVSLFERRRLGQHVGRCSLCWNRMVQEQILRSEVSRELEHINAEQRRDFSKLLPAILQEAGRPERQTLNRWGLFWVMLMTLITLLPLFPNFDEIALLPSQPLLNVPAATSTPVPGKPLTRATRQPMRTHISYGGLPSNLPKGFNMEYASPVPPPRLTAVASLQPAVGE